MRRTTILAVVTLALALSVNYAQAQAPNEFQVNYFSNANTASAPDGTLRITISPTPIAIGETILGKAKVSTGSSTNACSDIYVFNSNEEISECCSCLNTPNGLDTLSVNNDLTSNPLTGPRSTTGTVEILESSPVGNICPAAWEPVGPGLNFTAWLTHIQNSNFTITESPFQVSTLSEGEYVSLLNQCYAISLVGSGDGVCTCGVN